MDSASDYLQLTRGEYERLLIGAMPIDMELAERLEEITGKSRSFWIKREEQYRADISRLSENSFEAADNSVDWLKSLPVSEMIRSGWVEKKSTREETLVNLLQFFGVSSIYDWKERYSSELSVATFRASSAFNVNELSTVAWLRRAELIASNKKCSKWNKETFENSLEKIRALTLQKSPKVFWPELQKICADSGVCLVFTPPLSGCRAYGATRFLTPNKAMIVLSNRYKTDDHFWFTFFHEAGHLILHSKKALFIESTEMDRSHEEDEANSFAEKVLIPDHPFEELSGNRVTWKRIMRTALRLRIAPGILLGQLQHKGIVRRSSHNFLKRKFNNADFEDALTL